MAFLYNITMMAEGKEFVVSIDGNNFSAGSQLISNTKNTSDHDQLWSWILDPAIQAYILYNPGRDLCACPKALTDGGPVVLFQPTINFTPQNTWDITGWENAAIRSKADANCNLNAEGRTSIPGTTKLIVFHWGKGGTANERWTSKLIRTP